MPFAQHHDVDRSTFETPTFGDEFEITLERYHSLTLEESCLKRDRTIYCLMKEELLSDDYHKGYRHTRFLANSIPVRLSKHRYLLEYYPATKSYHWTCRNPLFQMLMDSREPSSTLFCIPASLNSIDKTTFNFSVSYFACTKYTYGSIGTSAEAKLRIHT